jgi:formylglycine-generating enzyme required for sulfatase activity
MGVGRKLVGICAGALVTIWSVASQSQSSLTPSSPQRPSAPAAAPATAAPPAPSTATVPEPGEIFRDCAECAEMVVVPAGEFKMGSDETIYEKPSHRVVIGNDFAIGRREVTFEEWDLCVVAGSCRYRPDDRGWGRGTRPVIDVSWDDAQNFVAWMSQKTGKKYRLPSEAEWEYAARAGTETPFWWGRTLVKGAANCEDCGDSPLRKTTPAQSLRPNGFGLFDVAGNAAEWVQDCWNDNYRGAPSNGSAWTTGQCQQRGLRGGSFATKAALIRSAARFRYDQDVRYYTNGFRIARDLR